MPGPLTNHDIERLVDEVSEGRNVPFLWDGRYVRNLEGITDHFLIELSSHVTEPKDGYRAEKLYNLLSEFYPALSVCLHYRD